MGFAAEQGPDAVHRAREKLDRKGIDLIVFNDVSRAEIGFDSEDNEVLIVGADAEVGVPLAPEDTSCRCDPRSGRGDADRRAGG